MAATSSKPPPPHNLSIRHPPAEGDSSDDSSDSSDHVPLFDPSGLTSSGGSGKDGSAGIDLNSHAAVRLGLSPPPQSNRATSHPLLERASSRSQVTRTPSAQDLVQRGRRRRSSENLAPSATGQAVSGAQPVPEPTPPETDAVEQRNGRPALSIEAHGRYATRVLPQRQSSFSPSPASSLRSPAADFLTAFGSLNSMVQPAPDQEWRTPSSSHSGSRPSSINVSRSREPSLAAQHLADVVNARAVDRAPSNFQALSSAAAELMTESASEASVARAVDVDAPFDPEVQGSTFGPSNRYELGRLLGFGGFSTIREGWDRGEDRGNEAPRKIAIKVIYVDQPSQTPTQAQSQSQAQVQEQEQEQELTIWRSLPAHPHLLPLLYDERMSRPRSGDTSSAASPASSFVAENQLIQLLVMPLCEGGNLLDYVKTEGGSRQSNAAASSLSRSQSLTNAGSVSPSPSSSPYQSRTGSVILSQRNSSALAASLAKTPSTSVMRRASSAVPRSQGVSLKAAREILQQLAAGLQCLHHDVEVLHGDMKLENVLAEAIQDQIGQHTTAADARHRLQWRLADFGLSQKVKNTETKTPSERIPFFQRSSSRTRFGKGKPEKSASTADGNSMRQSARPSRLGLGGGGSLAYTPPEVWREGPAASTPTADDVRVSPFASDMWALGCIVYALVSGKMPFNDSFEPRLQAKIAKGDWEVPPRLWRRARRLASAAARNSTGASMGSVHHSRSVSGRMSESRDREAQRGSFGSISEYDRFGNRSGVARHMNTSRYAPEDLSASLPALPDPQYRAARIDNNDAAAAHEAPIVGSVPSRPEAPLRFDIDVVAQAAADAEPDPESDGESTIDQAWDGTSSERAAAREVLRGLLEPEPAKRWTVAQLLASRWLSAPSSDPTAIAQVSSAGRSRALPNVTEGVPLGEEQPQAAETASKDGEASSAKKPQWNREKTWRPDLTFERLAPATKSEDDKASTRRESSLTRSRPSEGTRTPSNASGSRSGSRPRKISGFDGVGREIDEDADTSIVVHRSNTSSPQSERKRDAADGDRSAAISATTSRTSTPSQPVEIRGRRPRMAHNTQGIEECERLLERNQRQNSNLRSDTDLVKSPLDALAQSAHSASTQARSSSTSRLGFLGGKPLTRPSSSSSVSSTSSTTSSAARISTSYFGPKSAKGEGGGGQPKRSRSRPPMLQSYYGTSLGGPGANLGRASNFAGSPTDHRGSPTVSSFTESSTRSSTSRSRSRAPEALAHLLGSSLGASNGLGPGSIPSSSRGSPLSSGPNRSGTPGHGRGDDRAWEAAHVYSGGAGGGDSPHRRLRGSSLSGPVAVPRSVQSSRVAEFGLEMSADVAEEDEEEDGGGGGNQGRGRGGRSGSRSRSHSRRQDVEADELDRGRGRAPKR
ncbi:unnamed protein product [Parajaminaea phylloscopi]